jgi:hypothetical protein
MRKLSVHCWGGLGSQFYAWAMAEMMVRKFPRRKIQIVFHSSGVTKRYSDLKFLSSVFNIKFTDDYISYPESNQKPSTGHYPIRIILKKFLHFTRITLYCNTNDEFNRVKPWTLSLRGHYSYINLDVNITARMLFKIYEEFGRPLVKSIKQDNSLSVHYRLGDLKHLENKTYVDANDLGRCIEKIISSKECKTVTVHSDDQVTAKQLLHGFLPSETAFIDSDVWNTLFDLIETNYFIGTNSKISLWAAIFRKELDDHSWVYLPKQMKVAAEGNLLNLVDSKNTYYY